MIDLTINTDLARKILTGFIQSEVNRVGYSHAVVGLSGGVDSALSCYLTAEALGPEKVLALMGTGLIAQKVESQIQELNLAACLRLLPYQEDVAPFIAASDVVAFPSIRPHFARPVIEAAAMGKPSVGSDLGGVNELIEHERTGILVEPGSSSALAAALKNL